MSVIHRVKKGYIFVLICVVVITGWWVMHDTPKEAPRYEPAYVARGDVAYIVSVTGHLEPDARINLSFIQSGIVDRVFAEEGKRVREGAPLATLDSTLAQATLRKAQATLRNEEARLRDMVAPLRTQTYRQYQTRVENAKEAYESAVSYAQGILAQAYTVADDVVRTDADTFFQSSRGATPEFGLKYTYGTTDYIIKADNETQATLNTMRTQITDILETMRHRASPNSGAVLDALMYTNKDLAYIEDFFDMLARTVNEYVAQDSTAYTVYGNFKTTLSSARSSLASARATVLSAQKSLVSASGAYRDAQKNFDVALAGASNDAVSAQYARVEMARAEVERTHILLTQHTITAPRDGIIAKRFYDEGEAVTPQQVMFVLVSEGVRKVEAYIPEADIVDVALGQRASLTLDAFEDAYTYSGEVARIAYAETVRDGVPTYKTDVVLVASSSALALLKPGMTADVDIHIAERKHVLYIPTRSIVRDGTHTYVYIYDGDSGAYKKVPIKVGLRGSEGTTEVQDGLSEGQEIVLYSDDI